MLKRREAYQANGAWTSDASAHVPVRTRTLICPRNRIGTQWNIIGVNHLDACGIALDVPEYGIAFIFICQE